MKRKKRTTTAKRIKEDRKRLEENYGGGIDALNTQARAENLKPRPQADKAQNSASDITSRTMSQSHASNFPQQQPATIRENNTINSGLRQAASLPDANDMTKFPYPNHSAQRLKCH